MPPDPAQILRDTGRPCPACGNYAYVEGTVNNNNGPVFCERKGRAFQEKLQGKGKSKIEVRVCTKCGLIRPYAIEMGTLLNDPSYG